MTSSNQKSNNKNIKKQRPRMPRVPICNRIVAVDMPQRHSRKARRELNQAQRRRKTRKRRTSNKGRMGVLCYNILICLFVLLSLSVCF
jgi:hypothetical protein